MNEFPNRLVQLILKLINDKVRKQVIITCNV